MLESSWLAMPPRREFWAWAGPMQKWSHVPVNPRVWKFQAGPGAQWFCMWGLIVGQLSEFFMAGAVTEKSWLETPRDALGRFFRKRPSEIFLHLLQSRGRRCLGHPHWSPLDMQSDAKKRTCWPCWDLGSDLVPERFRRTPCFLRECPSSLARICMDMLRVRLGFERGCTITV